MKPTKLDEDVIAIIQHSIDVVENLQTKVKTEVSGLRRVLAKLYSFPVEEAEFLGVASIKDGGFVFDTRTHNLTEAGFVPVAPVTSDQNQVDNMIEGLTGALE